MGLIPCWSCGAKDRECYDECDCKKCVDPEGYEIWRYENPDQYERWLEKVDEDNPENEGREYQEH